ncbi:hypothetical protein [Actinomadura madurae]|uniref:hypothetical protein n=1 Tax=Actinomadura madurae TaxID=1993 RepID=UPI0020D240BD|nr:hypothetical protein [Actinomadura madurae]MCQ0015770.1 hypothetical protein [Actinomadura madurae]
MTRPTAATPPVATAWYHTWPVPSDSIQPHPSRVVRRRATLPPRSLSPCGYMCGSSDRFSSIPAAVAAASTSAAPDEARQDRQRSTSAAASSAACTASRIAPRVWQA